MDQYTRSQINAIVAKHTDVPPPWTVFDEHPYSICWRMGGGEGYKSLWWDWWQDENFPEAQRIDYFKRYPPPYCWLEPISQLPIALFPR